MVTMILKLLIAAVCLLLALRCLFARVPADPPPRAPDAADKAVYEFIFRNPPPASSPRKGNEQMARVVGFLLFGGLCAGLVVSALR